MVNIIKYEKIDSNNLRRWTKDNELTNKQDLQSLRNDYNFIANMSDTILEKLNMDATEVKTKFAELRDATDAILDLFNNSTTAEEIDFIDE